MLYIYRDAKDAQRYGAWIWSGTIIYTHNPDTGRAEALLHIDQDCLTELPWLERLLLLPDTYGPPRELNPEGRNLEYTELRRIALEIEQTEDLWFTGVKDQLAISAYVAGWNASDRHNGDEKQMRNPYGDNKAQYAFRRGWYRRNYIRDYAKTRYGVEY